MNVPIESLPPVTVLSGGDVFVINKEGSYTAKVTLETLKEYILGDLRSSLMYTGDEVTIGLQPGNVFYVKDEGIGMSKLTADLQQLLNKKNESGNGGDSTLTGTLTTFTQPVTATGDFIVVAIGTQYKAIRIWDYR